MTKLSPISRRDFITRLKVLGFEGPYPGGKHLYMIRREIRLTVPNPHSQYISVDLPSRILRQAGISRAEWTKGNQ